MSEKDPGDEISPELEDEGARWVRRDLAGEELSPEINRRESAGELYPDFLTSEFPLADASSSAAPSEMGSNSSAVEMEFSPSVAQPSIEEPEPRLLFQSWSHPVLVAPTRIPHLGHLCLLGVLALIGLVGVALLTQSALHLHLFGVTTIKQAATEIHYTLGSMAALYLVTLVQSLIVFPLFWHKSLFAGLHWRGAMALRLRNRLFTAAFVCFLLALLNGWLLPGPTNTPIDRLFSTRGAAWLLFGFGVSFAPFFEEMVFRGFLLPSLCTAFDWIGEHVHSEPAPSLDINGHPQWSLPAMAVASILTSIPFALMHAEQTGYSLGPFVLLVGVSLVLCWARLSTRSLAASVLVHAGYNFMLFSMMMVGTGGFRHLDKM